MKRPASLLACAALALAALLGSLWNQGEALPFFRALGPAQWTGYAALGSLLLSLSMRLLGDSKAISAGTRLLARRRFGITAALLAGCHLMVVWRLFYPDRLLEAVSDSFWLQCGAAAAGLLALLWLTSYPRMVRQLKIKNWTAIHALSYLAAGFAVLHFAVSPWSGVRLPLVAAAWFLAMMAWRLARYSKGSAGSGEGMGQIESGAANT